jgi:tryptophan synthase alpha chain
MSRIAHRFSELKTQGRKALIPYFTVGHPHLSIAVDIMHALVRAGSDVIELGVPFSDPMADGPVIQAAGEVALAQGVGLRDVLACVRQFRETDTLTPVVLMGYANPIERLGHALFIDEAAKAGVDGVLVVDAPPEEYEEFSLALRARGMDPIYLLAPTSTAARITSIAAAASGYVYYVSLKGITGAGNIDLTEVAQRVASVKAATGLPVGVGFGIRDAQTACAIAEHADAVVIGTRLIQELEAGSVDTAALRLQSFVHNIRLALDKYTGSTK